MLGYRLCWKRVKNDPMSSVLLELEAHQPHRSLEVQIRAAAWSLRQAQWGQSTAAPQGGNPGRVLGIFVQWPGESVSRPILSEMAWMSRTADGSCPRTFSGYLQNTLLRKNTAQFLQMRPWHRLTLLASSFFPFLLFSPYYPLPILVLNSTAAWQWC